MKCQFVFLFAVLCGVGQAQRPIGNVAVQDATVAGELAVNNGRAVLVANATVTAKDHTADVTLNRGGTVRVCATSGLHITTGKSATGPAPLMLSLDRGAIEVQMAATTSDVIMTPDLRFGIRSNGPLDLRLRVTSNGDTCVENRGAKAPTVIGADQFGESSYDLRPGQHVLFEHGSLKEVVDNESSPCGCPPAPAPAGLSLADAALKAGSPKQSAEAQHPFPAAISNGLAPPASVPQTPPGVVHAQVATTLSYEANTNAAEAANSPEPPSNPSPTVLANSPPAADTATPPAPQHSRSVVHWIGHFFGKLFGRG
jgi:hypothetical protein